MRFVDANIFLRFVVRGDTELERRKAQDCRALFERARLGSETVMTSEAVGAEVMYVLVSPRQYGLSHADAASRIRPLISLEGVLLRSKPEFLRALELFEANPKLDFEDALSVAYVESIDGHELYSYDRDFDSIEAIRRIEPGNVSAVSDES